MFHGPTRTPEVLRRRGAGGDGRRRGGERDTFLVRRGLDRLGGVRLRDPLAPLALVMVWLRDPLAPLALFMVRLLTALPLALRMPVLRRRFGLGIYNLERN